jgi:hypothetical protein
MRASVVASFLALVSFATPAVAQSARWRTVAGGDPSGDYVSVERPVHDGALSGDRTVERLTRATGYTTGSLTTIVVSGSEAEDARTIRVHLPYGAALDLQNGEHVHVTMHSHLLGLGSVHEVLITRGSTIVVAQTSAPTPPAGITIARGAEQPPNGSRRTFALDVRVAGVAATVTPSQLAWLGGASLLAWGSDIVYEGGVRPPDAFDQRFLVVARIQPIAPAMPAVSS